MNEYLAETLSGLFMLGVLVIPCAYIWHNENRRTRSRNNHPTNKNTINEQTEADLLGLINYLKQTPEYNTPNDNGKWLDRIITELTKITKQTETDNNQ